MDFHGHFSNPDQVNDKAFGIYENERRVFGSPTIACALNMWRFAIGLPSLHGYITIRNEAGDILYSHYQF